MRRRMITRGREREREGGREGEREHERGTEIHREDNLCHSD